MKLLNLNLGIKLDNSKDVIELIKKEQCDIVAFQEVMRKKDDSVYVKYDSTSFDGININYFDIQCPDEFVETFEQIGENFDVVQMYESIIFKDNMHRTQLDNVYKRISEDEIQITGLIGNNGKITDEELQKIHKLNLDKKRKLV